MCLDRRACAHDDNPDKSIGEMVEEEDEEAEEREGERGRDTGNGYALGKTTLRLRAFAKSI